MEYCGIADAHGIESFIKMDDASDGAIAVMQLRAECNDQRRAVFYVADLGQADVNIVLEHIKDKDFEAALNHIKENAETVKLGGPGNIENSWVMIPNPLLDPWA
jgi:hypothetical protein